MNFLHSSTFLCTFFKLKIALMQMLEEISFKKTPNVKIVPTRKKLIIFHIEFINTTSNEWKQKNFLLVNGKFQIEFHYASL